MAETFFDPKQALKYHGTLHIDFPAVPIRPKNIFELLGVAVGIRPTCFFRWFGEDYNKLSEIAHSFDRIAVLLDLKTVVGESPSLWFPDKGADASEDLRRSEGESIVVWFFRGSSTENAIARATAGEIDAGIVLGYPECCVRWHQAMRKKELAGWRSAKLTAVQERNERSIVELGTDAFSPRSAKRRATLTEKNYPFVSHVACNRCIADGHSPTARLNSSLDRLAKTVDPNFHPSRWAS